MYWVNAAAWSTLKDVLQLENSQPGLHLMHTTALKFAKLWIEMDVANGRLIGKDAYFNQMMFQLLNIMLEPLDLQPCAQAAVPFKTIRIKFFLNFILYQLDAQHDTFGKTAKIVNFFRQLY